MPILCTALFLGVSVTLGIAGPVKIISDIPFADADGTPLYLDLYMPEGVEAPPLVLSIFGGGWRSGSRKGPPNSALLEAGYAVAKIEYRLSTQAKFPAQINDCKAALRWLRSHATEYGYDASRVGVHGESAGGYLALLLGFTADDPRYDRAEDAANNPSTRVAAIVDFYGPTDFILRSKDQPAQTELPDGKVFQLLDGPVQKNLELAKLASPRLQVTSDDPPVLIFHGSADPTVLMNQSEGLREALQESGVPVELHVVEGAGHGGPGYDTPENWGKIIEFLDRCLKGAPKEDCFAQPKSGPLS